MIHVSASTLLCVFNFEFLFSFFVTVGCVFRVSFSNSASAAYQQDR